MPRVVAVAAAPKHQLSKQVASEIRLIARLGVAGDAHLGATTQHQSQVRSDPSRPNLRQVHLIHFELFGELAHKGHAVSPAALGENITTEGLDLLALPRGARLRLGAEAVVRLTGLRKPCRQLDAFQPGLAAALLEKTANGELLFKAGVMGVVLVGGVIRPGDAIAVELPSEPYQCMRPV